MPEFVCNLCLTRNEYLSLLDIDREWPSCSGCGSSARTRWIVRTLATHFHGRSLPISELPSAKKITGLGLSDGPVLAAALTEKFSYTNTFFDGPPVLNITQNIQTDMVGRFDFVVASEVFEHVFSPVQKAFDNLASLLKPGGVAVFSVPWFGTETLEYFPNLHKWEITSEAGRLILLNRKSDNEQERFEDLSFHDGPGSTLEMRRFGRRSLEANFAQAKFESVTFAEPGEDYGNGIIFHRSFSLPCIARRRRRASALLKIFRATDPIKTKAPDSDDGLLLMDGWYAVEEGRRRWTYPKFSFAAQAREGNRGVLAMTVSVSENMADSDAAPYVEAHVANTPIFLTHGLQPGIQTIRFELPGPVPPHVWTIVECSTPASPVVAGDCRTLGIVVPFVDSAGSYQQPFVFE